MNKPKPPEEIRWFDPRKGDAPFRLEPIASAGDLRHPQRSNYFTILALRRGSGRFSVDLAQFHFAAPALLFFNPYQTYFFTLDAAPEGMKLQFHANFFCIETHHEAVGCNGVLFNDTYGPQLVEMEQGAFAEFDRLILQMDSELQNAGLAGTEALVSYLKVFLIKASRMKVDQQRIESVASVGAKPEVIHRLTDLVEKSYRTMHRPVDFSNALSITPKALGKLVKQHLGKTLTQLIRDRILKDAKWQLLHTSRPVKAIAWELGFADELYFSRLFKEATSQSPTEFREFEISIRKMSNLSM